MKPHERKRYKWKDNIKMKLKGMGWRGVEWIHIPQIETSGGLL
jgi:hypothetical protein